MKTDKSLEGYFQEAASWDADREAMNQRSARLAWWVAGAGWLCAVVACIGIACLSPMKTVVPFLLRVDNTTGVVDVVPTYAGKATFTESVTRYLLTRYVIVCERFIWATAESDYEECGAFNSPRRNQAWAAQWATSNPSSPLNLFKDGTTVRPHIVSVSFFTRANGVADLAQIRYTKGRQTADDSGEQLTHWIATIQYAYAVPSKDPRTRQWNPVGFKVVEFHAEPEVEGPSASPGSTGAGPGAQPLHGAQPTTSAENGRTPS